MKIGLISDIHKNDKYESDILSKSVENIFKKGAIGLVMAGDIGDYHARHKASFEVFKDKFQLNTIKNLY